MCSPVGEVGRVSIVTDGCDLGGGVAGRPETTNGAEETVWRVGPELWF